MSQNRQEEKDRSRAKKDYMINLKAELEIRMLHEKIDHLILHQQQDLLEIQNIQVLAEKDIRKKINEFKITEKAETNARIFLDQWIRSFGFTSVKISTI